MALISGLAAVLAPDTRAMFPSVAAPAFKAVRSGGAVFVHKRRKRHGRLYRRLSTTHKGI